MILDVAKSCLGSMLPRKRVGHMGGPTYIRASLSLWQQGPLDFLEGVFNPKRIFGG